MNNQIKDKLLEIAQKLDSQEGNRESLQIASILYTLCGSIAAGGPVLDEMTSINASFARKMIQIIEDNKTRLN